MLGFGPWGTTRSRWLVANGSEVLGLRERPVLEMGIERWGGFVSINSLGDDEMIKGEAVG